MGATTVDDQGEWAIVGGTGDFARARGVIKRKVHQQVPDGEVLELTIDAYCHMKTTQLISAPDSQTTTHLPPPTLKKHGLWGNLGGSLYDIAPHVPSRLVSVSFYPAGSWVKSFQFSFIDQDGNKRTSDLFGFPDGFGNKTVELGPTEFLNEVSVRDFGGCLIDLKLVTVGIGGDKRRKNTINQAHGSIKHMGHTSYVENSPNARGKNHGRQPANTSLFRECVTTPYGGLQEIK